MMNEEQSIPADDAEAGQDTNTIFSGDSSLQSESEFKSDKTDNDDYYEVDKPKKSAITSIGNGEMRNEGTVGMGDMPEENLFSGGAEPAETDDES